MAVASSSSTMLAICSSLTTQCRISKQLPNQNPQPLFSISKPKFYPSSSSSSSSSISYKRPTFTLTPKFSQSEEATVLESEREEPVSESQPDIEPASAQIVEATAAEPPKREEVFAVVMIGSRQYIVFPGRFIYTQRLKGANVNDKIILNKVLLVGTKTTTYIGKPVVTNAAVHAVVEEQGLNPKVVVFKYKKKKNYRRNIGHRQPNTRIRITGITGYQDYPAVTLDSLNLKS